MSEFLKIAGVCLIAALLGAVLDKRDRPLSIALGLLAGAIALFACIKSVRPAARLIEELSELSGLGGDYFAPLLKTVGIGIVTQLACAVCADCGSSAAAKVAEVCGVLAALVLSVPLLRAALDVIRQMMGG